ncbi:MAG: hypothetical protein A3I43_06325 [Omnitrophica WOR_2 bacterium RIFCSPLOWO2_02_FULL_50_19]|nr:MAG: hypothetical protein A3I43_06325 [Omnitrophica WOR_2 bacterium RIFCSPLOWO2_02_FULL_50_19]
MSKAISLILLFLISLSPAYIFAQEASSDVTPPTAPIITVDKRSNSLDLITASLKSEDPESSIMEYQYAVGMTPGGTDIIYWTGNGANEQLFIYGLKLEKDKLYYLSAAAKNGAGLKSTVSTSPPIRAMKEPWIKIIWPPHNSLMSDDKDTVVVKAEGVDKVDINGREMKVSADETVRGPVFVSPGYAARNGITKNNPDYLIMDFPGKTTIEASSGEEKDRLFFYYYQAFIKSSMHYEGHEESVDFEYWNTSALKQAPFEKWLDRDSPSRIRVKKKYSYLSGPWRYGKKYQDKWSFAYRVIQYPGFSDTCASSLIVHTPPLLRKKQEPMVLAMQNCELLPLDNKGPTSEISRYKIMGMPLKWLYWDLKSALNCAYVRIDEYKPDSDVELKIEIPIYDATIGGKKCRIQNFAFESIDLIELETVRESPYLPGKYFPVHATPIFQPDDGKGRGYSIEDVPFLQIKLNSDLSSNKVNEMKVGLKIGNKNLSFDLIETGPGSGIFYDPSKKFKLEMKSPEETSSQVRDELSCSVSYPECNINEKMFNLRESATDSLFFNEIKIFATIKFDQQLSPDNKDKLEIDYENEMLASQETLIEADNNSLIFSNNDGSLVVRINNFNGALTDHLDVNVHNKNYLALSNPRVYLKKVDPAHFIYSVEFEGKETDLEPNNPAKTGEGVFRIRVRGLHNVPPEVLKGVKIPK